MTDHTGQGTKFGIGIKGSVARATDEGHLNIILDVVLNLLLYNSKLKSDRSDRPRIVALAGEI